MPRPHIEFVQTQNIDWQEQSDGTAAKLLNVAPESGEATLLVRYPPGYASGAMALDDGAEEYFVLEGVIRIDGIERRRHAYGFLPRAAGKGARDSADGATLLIFRHGRDDIDSLAGTADEIALDTPAMPWDVSTYDPALTHLRLARKVLRLGPNDSGRTFLLTGLPHGVPDVTALPTETHDHCEEMFMLAGEMSAPEGQMQAGAYFFRPPGIVHGPHVSETGFFQIMRSPGANRIVTHWSTTLRPLPIGAPYAPIMPAGTPDSWRRPWTGAPLF
jgi:hypothetical protein